MSAVEPRLGAAFEPENFGAKSAAALADPKLRVAITAFTGRVVLGRYLARAGLPEFDELTALARDLKNEILAHLDQYLQQFEAAVEAHAGHVHWARDGQEARAIILDLCRQAGAKTVVKAKSMVSEEIDLGAALEGEGLRNVETDLGEYIIQLRDERPSHLIAPAMHLSKAQVAETFKAAHTSLDPARPMAERRALVREARQMLRADFAAAEVGITGANFLIADTGSAVIVTNEGNADLAACVPRTHIVLTGIEKLVRSFDDAAVFLRLLARSATGQEITSYTSLYGGPRQAREAAGPTAFHVVLLDNGRSALLGTPSQDMLRCIRCAACLNHCPVFAAIGGHGYGSVYSGPIGAALTPALVGLERAKDLPEASSFCGRCEEVCPVKIPLPRLLREWREREFERHLTPGAYRWALGLWTIIASRPWLYRWACGFGRFGLTKLARAQGGAVHRLPGLAGGWTSERDLTVGTGPTFQAAWRKGRR
jgi:L-lactate dehydrogenase complex protein LldF